MKQASSKPARRSRVSTPTAALPRPASLRGAAVLANRYRSALSGKRWLLTIDPLVAALLTAKGGRYQRLVSAASSPHDVLAIPLSDAELRGIRPLVDRLGLLVKPFGSQPPTPTRRKAS
jgi:hypothetical protein